MLTLIQHGHGDSSRHVESQCAELLVSSITQRHASQDLVRYSELNCMVNLPQQAEKPAHPDRPPLYSCCLEGTICGFAMVPVELMGEVCE